MTSDHAPPVPSLSAGDRSRLMTVLAESKRLGFLGPGPVNDQIDRSLGLVPALQKAVRGGVGGGAALTSQTGAVRQGPSAHPFGGEAVNAVDLGTGGGLPGLVLAVALPSWCWTLLDGSVRRTQFLGEAVTELGLGAQVSVVDRRAEEAARGPLRTTYDVLVARGFAGPAATAECAAPFLKIGGAAVITEPPGGAPLRWPADGLAELGMVAEHAHSHPVAVQILRQRRACPERYPRRVGVPVKRPLWGDAR